MFRNLLILLLLSFMSAMGRAQVKDPVRWNFGYEKKGSNLYELVISATIEEDSYIYSMKVPENGPVPTTVNIDTSSLYIVEGLAYEATIPEEKYDEAFGIKLKTFSGKAEFRQKIISEESYFKVKGVVTYMSCTKSNCLPPRDEEFTVTIGKSVMNEQSVTASNIAGGTRGMLKFFLGSFLLGLIGVLTPCVYPMIPMTVAFFTRMSEKKSGTLLNAVVFGISIVLIYTLPGLIISLTGAGAGFANALSTHWIPNVIFFLLFVVFAASFFGAFEIILPGSWVNKADSKVDRGGLLASFFLALTTVIVSFSCTGPIAGSLLVEAVSGGILRPAVGMFAFGLAFAIPFTLFALFPSVMNKLPKSGGWLNSIKVVLGFMMLAFSMRFLTTIDSVYGLNVISREVFLSVWIVIFSLTGFYLMGKIRFAHDSEHHHTGVFRLFFTIAAFSFVVYMIPGLFGAEMKGLASMLPAGKQKLLLPAGRTLNYNTPVNQPFEARLTAVSDCSEPKYAGKFSMPYGLTGYFDYQQGLICAKQTGRPVLLDFKGHACSSCKLMEAKVWSDPRVLERLRKFVIIALYTDDRTQLPENEWITSDVDGKIKKTIGRINEDLQIRKFNTNAIPLYVITDYDGNPLNKPMASNTNKEEYLKWLDEGLNLFAGATGK